MLIDIKPDNTKSLIKPPVSERLKLGCVELAPGKEIGMHPSSSVEEIILVLEGEAIVIDEGKEVKMQANQAYFIGKDREHNVLNKSKKPVRYCYLVAEL